MRQAFMQPSPRSWLPGSAYPDFARVYPPSRRTFSRVRPGTLAQSVAQSRRQGGVVGGDARQKLLLLGEMDVARVRGKEDPCRGVPSRPGLQGTVHDPLLES